MNAPNISSAKRPPENQPMKNSLTLKNQLQTRLIASRYRLFMFVIVLMLGISSAEIGPAAARRALSRRPAPAAILVGVVSGEGESDVNIDAVVLVKDGKLTAP